jgi:hypothetical protein
MAFPEDPPLLSKVKWYPPGPAALHHSMQRPGLDFLDVTTQISTQIFWMFTTQIWMIFWMTMMLMMFTIFSQVVWTKGGLDGSVPVGNRSSSADEILRPADPRGRW